MFLELGNSLCKGPGSGKGKGLSVLKEVRGERPELEVVVAKPSVLLAPPEKRQDYEHSEREAKEILDPGLSFDFFPMSVSIAKDFL